MPIRHRALRAVLCWGVVFAIAGCRESSAPERPVDGTFSLAAFGGQPLPVRDIEIPGRDGRATGCFAMVVSGWLTLDAQRGTFTMGAHREDSCGVTSFGNDTSAIGRFTRTGSSLEFAADIGAGHTEPFVGRVSSDRIDVDTHWGSFQFRR
jgi:hypothetical protein